MPRGQLAKNRHYSNNPAQAGAAVVGANACLRQLDAKMVEMNCTSRLTIVILAISAVSSGQGTSPSQTAAAQPLKLCSHKNHAPCVDKPPVVIDSPDPEYSVAAHNAKIEGTVVLFATIGTDGLTHDIQVARPLGYGLDELAVEAVKRWTFKPAKSQGKAVQVKINIEVPFRYR